LTRPHGEWISARVGALDDLLRRHDYRGWDPFDLTNAPLLQLIPSSWWLPQLLLSKLGARAVPDWLRRALRVPEIEDPKIYACSYFAYDNFARATGSVKAREMVERLACCAKTSPYGSHWGYDYTWGTRTGGVNPRRASSLVPGSFALFALLHHLTSSGDSRHRDLISSAIEYYRTRHRRAGPDGEFLGYFADSTINTHNANVLAAAALSIAGHVFDRKEWMRDAARAAETTARSVTAEGYLPYAAHPSGDWTDCFHHLYTTSSLEAIKRLNSYADSASIEVAIVRLRSYLRREFLRQDGLLNYYPGCLYPIDPHNYAAAAIFALLSGKEDDLSPAAAEPLLRKVDELMWDESRGRYLFRRHRHRVDKRLFLRWTQAWMFAALSLVRAYHSDGRFPLRERPRDRLVI
jgi:hypothetical protein